MKTIYLKDKAEVTITDEAYEDILQIIAQNRICSTCQNHFSPDNPRVALNVCLRCFMRGRETLTFLGELSRNDRGDVTYRFLDRNGYVSTLHDFEGKLHHSSYRTLVHWGFPVPETIEEAGKTVRLNWQNWSIHGDVRQHSVLVIEHTVASRQFLSYRNSASVPLNKRKAEIRLLFKQALDRLEASRGADRHYHTSEDFDDEGFLTVWTSHVYLTIAQIMSERIDALHSALHAEENSTEE